LPNLIPKVGWEDFSAEIRLKSDNADAYFLGGNTYVALERNSLAMEDYSRAIELDPQHAAPTITESFYMIRWG
jgi:tetratricopeptide (TPR) repeat protein